MQRASLKTAIIRAAISGVAALMLCSAPSAWAQQKQKVSYKVTGEDSKYTQRNTLDDHRARMTMLLEHRDRPLLDTPELLFNLAEAGHCTKDQAWDYLEQMFKAGRFDHPMSKHRKAEYVSGRFYVPRTRI